MNFKVGISSVSFSKSEYLVSKAKKMFKQVVLNPLGRKLKSEEFIQIYKDCDAIIVALDIINKDILNFLPNLKVISKYGVGTDNIDFQACAERGIEVLIAKGVNKRSAAELTLGFMLGFMRNIFSSIVKLKKGEWVCKGGSQLTGKTVGIIGVGNIGKEVVKLLKPFKCKVLCNDIVNIDFFCKENGAVIASKEEIFCSADIISLHVPLTEKTKYLINEESLRLMKPTALLINTSRGAVVDIKAVKRAIMEKRLGGICFDVFEEEPFYDEELFSMDNVFCTPHIGGSAKEAILAMGEYALVSLSTWIEKNIKEM